MTEDKLIDELWKNYAIVSHWKPSGTGENLMDCGNFVDAIRAALERQRRGCADAYRKKLKELNYSPTAYWGYEQAIENAPPAGEDDV